MDFNDYSDWVTHPAIQALIIAGIGLVLAVTFDQTVGRFAASMAQKSKTRVDDEVTQALRPVLKHAIIILGLWVGAKHAGPPDLVLYVIKGLLGTWAIGITVMGCFEIAQSIIRWFSRHQEAFHAVNARTVPIFDMCAKGIIIGVGLYFTFLAWDIDVTGWLASAGVLGVILGFGAKDTTADLFAGVFILAEAPYKRGDYLLLETGARGRVMATAQITNESGGPQEIERVNVPVSVAYGSDMDQVREILLRVASEIPGVLQDDPLHTSSVHFESMGDSGLALLVRVWIVRPELQLSVIDQLNDRIYKALNEAGIEIPYPKRDVYIHKDG
jgi:MscS family membrane protein